jgi:hypothetical protein
MTELNETDIETISGAVTEGGCIPRLPGERTIEEILRSLTGGTSAE